MTQQADDTTQAQAGDAGGRHPVFRHELIQHGARIHVEIARRFADDARARCFTPDGRLTAAAGVHLHSVLGTVDGMLELGLILADHSYVEHARRIVEESAFKWRRTARAASAAAPAAMASTGLPSLSKATMRQPSASSVS